MKVRHKPTGNTGVAEFVDHRLIYVIWDDWRVPLEHYQHPHNLVFIVPYRKAPAAPGFTIHWPAGSWRNQ